MLNKSSDNGKGKNKGSGLGKLNFSFLNRKNISDIVIAVTIVAIVMMLVIPVTGGVLDFLMALNLVISLIILLIIMNVRKANDFNIFPSLLLLTTVFRLAINVSSTRLILLKGPEFDGNLIRAFGNFVVQGNYIVGIIIFAVILAVNIIVITKGATRISEVAARFTLDAMPGKQMSIDADLSAGIIDEREAIKRRLELRRETDFYGAMDGASKFDQGDVKVGLLITLINIVGGLLVGTIMMGMDIQEAFNLFILLTIGDGLVASIPSLLLSTATGILVTRSVSDGSLGEDLGNQLTASPLAFGVGAFVLLVLSFMPGFPTIILLILAILAGVIAYFLWRSQKNKRDEENSQEEDVQPSMPESTVDLVNVEPFVLEIGFNLIPFADEEQGRDLLERIKLIRKTLALEMGIVVPTIRIIDNLRLRPSDYSIKLNGVEVGKGSLRVNKLLAIPSVDMKDDLEGEESLEPVFRTKAKWIDETQREKAEGLGYSVVDPPSIIATHITEVIKRNATEIMDVQKVKQILDSVRETSPTAVDEALKVIGNKYGFIQRILHNLLREGISIRNMVAILETIAEYGDKVTNVDLLTEYVRQKLAKQISKQFADDNDRMVVFTLDPEIERMLEESLQETDSGFVSTLGPEYIQAITRRTSDAIASISNMGVAPIVLASPNVRAVYKGVIERALPDIAVLSYNEVTKDVMLEHAGTITLRDESQQAQQEEEKEEVEEEF